MFIYYGEILMDQQKFDEAEAMFDAGACVRAQLWALRTWDRTDRGTDVGHGRWSDS